MNTKSMTHRLQMTLTALLAAGITPSVIAAPINQGFYPSPGALQEGSNNHVGMAKSGRYVPFASSTTMYLKDIKTQETITLAAQTDRNFYAISPNGRYVSFGRQATTVILDRVTATEVVIPAEPNSNIGLSDNGYALFNTATNRQLVRFDIKTQQQQTTGITNASLGDNAKRHPLSSDGKIALFSAAGSYKIYNFATNQITALNPQTAAGAPLSVQGLSGSPYLASSGKFLIFIVPAPDFGYLPKLYRLNLEAATQIADTFDMSTKSVSVEGGVSITANGRFISFYGKIKQGHPEWAVANAISPDTSLEGYPRILRYDTQLDQLATMSTAFNGGPLESKSGTCCIPLRPLVNSTSIISDDGSMVEFATSSPTVASITNNLAAEANYHAFLSNGFARNYQFVDMPNSDNAFKAFAPMTLVGNNQWEGTISFDGVGTESFKFDAGGTLVNGAYTATANWAINFGAGSTAGQSVASGGNIPVTGGAGTYTITFNDQTLKYTITKQNPNADWKRTVVMVYGETQTGQDMFIRGGLDHQKALANLNINCDANQALCSMPIRYTNTLNPTTAPWKQGDTKLDWQGIEVGQGSGAQGSPLDWTTDIWPSSWGAKKTVAINGYGETPLNLWGQHYWLLDVEMDCSKTYNGWFELKSFISNGPGWEANVAQANTPWASNNHFAQCGKMNVFKRGQSAPVVVGGTL